MEYLLRIWVTRVGPAVTVILPTSPQHHLPTTPIVLVIRIERANRNSITTGRGLNKNGRIGEPSRQRILNGILVGPPQTGNLPSRRVPHPLLIVPFRRPPARDPTPLLSLPSSIRRPFLAPLPPWLLPSEEIQHPLLSLVLLPPWLLSPEGPRRLRPVAKARARAKRGIKKGGN